MIQMKLGWWRDRGGQEHEIVDGGRGRAWRSTKEITWGDDGSYWCDRTESEYDLIEFLRPLEYLVDRLPDDGSAIQMRLGYWEDAQGAEWCVCNHHPATPFPWQTQGGTRGWDNAGKPSWKQGCSLVAFLRPLEDLPPALNAAVKAAEDWVRRMEAQYHAAQKLANQACDDMNHARRELERLEKECEVKA